MHQPANTKFEVFSFTNSKI